MPSQTTIIKLGGVNCYLLPAGDGYVLIDTGFSGKRALLETRLERVGCRTGTLKLIVLTHGDADHVGNADFLRTVYGCKIAMHSLDTGMVERGDMSASRKAKPDKMSLLARLMFFGARTFLKSASNFEKFTPDMLIDEAFDLSVYGLNAKVLHLPGHSKGSIGVLTDDGNLFSGDFAIPKFGYVDDMDDHNASMEKLIQFNIETIYPGHGKPFTMRTLIRRA